MTSLVVPPVAPARFVYATLYRVSVFHGGARLLSYMVHGIRAALDRADFFVGKGYEVVEISADEGFVVASWMQSK